MGHFTSYEDAYSHAVQRARQSGRDVGIERFMEYGTREVFLVRALPNPENRFGPDLRCEVVTPNSPR